jgi:replicative DNA helicase
MIDVPQDLNAEGAVLGAVLLSDKPMRRLIVDVGLTGAAFYRAFNGRVWDAMVALAMRGDSVDPITLRAELGDLDEQQRQALEELPAEVPMAANVLGYARRVIEMAEWRQVLQAGYSLQASAVSRDPDARRTAEAELHQTRRSVGDTDTPQALTERVWRHLEQEPVKAWQTPFAGLTEKMGGGLRAGEVTLLGGWTSHGKSVIVDQLLRHAHYRGAKVHLYINEMSPVMRALRVVASITGVPQKRLVQPKTLQGEDYKRVMALLKEGLPFGVTDVNDWSADDVARDIRFREWDVCALDLIHRLPFREERDLAHISSLLNAAAHASGAHLIGVVHLNELRAVSATLPPPVLRDIRASGMLKNDADNVMFIYRDEEISEGITTRLDSSSLYLAKCRNGELGGCRLNFEGSRLRFLETAREMAA